MRIAFASLCVLFAAGCDSGSSTTPQVEIPATVKITAENALDAAQACVRAAFDIQRVAYVGIGFLLTPTPEPPELPASPNPAVLPAQLSVTVSGPFGGSALFTWSDEDGNERYSTGDGFTITFDAYGDQGVILDGAMVLRNPMLEGLVPSEGTWVATADLEMIGLAVTVGVETWTLNTTLPVRLENRQIVQLFELVLPADLQFGPSELKQGNRMERYESAETVTLIFDGAAYVPALDGVLKFETSGVLTGFPFFPNPTDGLMVVRGSEGSLLEIQPLFFQLEIRVDENGDEEFEATLSSSWQELLPQ